MGTSHIWVANSLYIDSCKSLSITSVLDESKFRVYIRDHLIVYILVTRVKSWLECNISGTEIGGDAFSQEIIGHGGLWG